MNGGQGNEMTIHLQTLGSSSFSEAFVVAADTLKYKNGRDHRLLILSCYIDFEAVKDFSTRIEKKVRLIEIDLAFEFMEAFRGRLPNDTLSELEELRSFFEKRDIKFCWHPVRLGSLMHAKGYAVIQLGLDGPRAGVVAIGSGNATLPGLGLSKKGRATNIELAQISTEIGDVHEFLKIWGLVCKKRRELDDASRREDAYSFVYSLLASGVFLHDWRDSLRSQVGIIYPLTPEGQRAITVDESLRQLFDVHQATFSRSPLIGIDLSGFGALPQGFTRRYTIDSLVGRWCPMSVWSVVEAFVERDEGFKIFALTFRKATAPRQLQETANTEQQIVSSMIERGFVSDDPQRIDRWKTRVERLRDNERMLTRIYLKFAPFELPYDYQRKEDIEYLRNSLFDSIEIKRTQSSVARKVIDAEKRGDLSALELTPDETTSLETLLGASDEDEDEDDND